MAVENIGFSTGTDEVTPVDVKDLGDGDGFVPFTQIVDGTAGGTDTMVVDSSGRATVYDVDANTKLGSIVINTTNIPNAIGADGGTVPIRTFLVGGSDGTLIQDLKVDSNGRLSVDVNSTAIPTGAATSAKQDTIIGHVDGIETLIGTTNSTLTTIDGRVDGLETLIGTTNTTLTTIDGRVDGLETLIGTTNTTLTAIDGRVDGLEALVGTTNTNLTDLPNVIGTDGSTGPSKALSVAGTDGSGNLQELKTNTAGELVIDGQIASGATDSGNPTKIGGRFNSTTPTLTDGQRGDLQMDSRGNVRTTLVASSGTQGISIATPGDASSNTAGLVVNAQFMAYDGSQWLRPRGDVANGLDVDVTRVTGTVTVNAGRGATPTLANVAGSATSVTLIASNANRLSATIVNDSTVTLYVKYGSAASATSFTWKLLAGDTVYIDDYTGILTGIWDSATGNARNTEVAA